MTYDEVDIPEGPHSVHRWRDALTRRVGLSTEEIDERVAQLEAVCRHHGITPATLLVSWEERASLTDRRRSGTGERPSVVVESFLIHNGVNVFGEAAVRSLARSGAWGSAWC